MEALVHVQHLVLTLRILYFRLISNVVLWVLQLNLIEASALTAVHIAELVLINERFHFVGASLTGQYAATLWLLTRELGLLVHDVRHCGLFTTVVANHLDAVVRVLHLVR